MNCDICKENNIGPDHEISDKHLKNKALFEYSQLRKQFSGNRKGVIVSCNVRSSFQSHVGYTEGKIKVSAKPNEEVTFNFTIKNDTNKESINVVFVQQMVHSKLNFVMNDHGMGFGSNPVLIKPKAILRRDVSVRFKCGDIGQYDMPVIFSFRKPDTNESIIIMRDMVVFVEEKQSKHEKIDSPYALKEVVAEKLFKSTLADRGENKFPIPRNYKHIYASNLKLRENASEDEKELCDDVKKVFDDGVKKENYIKFFHNLLWFEETIVRINLKKYNMSGVPLLQQGKSYALVVPGLGEKRPSLMLGDLLFVRPHDKDVMFEAVVADIMADNIAQIRGLHTDFNKYYTFNARFDIRFFMSRLPLERMHLAVNDVTSDGPNKCRVFPKENKSVPPITSIRDYYNPLVEANPEQRSCVERVTAGSAGRAPFMLHGPPGTGKTVTIVEAILQLVSKSADHHILVCTDSNMAADHVATLIIQYAHMFDQNLLLRANSKFRVWEPLPECLRKHSNGWNRENFEHVSIEMFLSYRIVVTTLSHAAKFAKQFKDRRMARPITHLFIDEAAQASEPACLIPVCGLLSPTGHLVLAGDPCQLGPVVISHEARRRGLGLSLMERLKNTCPLYSDERNDPNYMVMLRNNFRSHKDILELPNEIFYKGQLRVHAQEDSISSVDILGERKESRAIVFHGVLSKEQRMGKSPSYFNSMELELVKQYILALVRRHQVKPEDIGVVTPYIRQVYLIKNWLASKSFDGKVEVGTVEAFQGKEKRVIVISTVRANCGLLDHDAKFQLGFLVDDKRFNVALTRAKAKAIIIGNPECLQIDAKWRAYMAKCRQLGTYFGYDPETYKTADVQTDILNSINPILRDLKLSKAKA